MEIIEFANFCLIINILMMKIKTKELLMIVRFHVLAILACNCVKIKCFTHHFN